MILDQVVRLLQALLNLLFLCYTSTCRPQHDFCPNGQHCLACSWISVSHRGVYILSISLWFLGLSVSAYVASALSTVLLLRKGGLQSSAYLPLPNQCVAWRQGALAAVSSSPGDPVCGHFSQQLDRVQATIDLPVVRLAKVYR